MQFLILIHIYIYTSILQDSHWFLWLSDVPVVCLSRPWQITRLTPWFFETLKNSVNQSMAPSMEIRLTGSHNGAMLLILFAAVMADPPSIGPLPSCHLRPSKRPSALLPTRRSPVCPVCWRHPSICSVKLYFNCLNNLHFFKAVKWNGADPLFQKNRIRWTLTPVSFNTVVLVEFVVASCVRRDTKSNRLPQFCKNWVAKTMDATWLISKNCTSMTVRFRFSDLWSHEAVVHRDLGILLGLLFWT